MNTFTPQLSQEDLAEMIDREGLAFEAKLAGINNWQSTYSKATWHVKTGWKIRLAPGSLTEFNLKPGMVPHNPNNLPAVQITDDGEYRACVEGDILLTGIRVQAWVKNKWATQRACNTVVLSSLPITLRVPVSTPFPKVDNIGEFAEMPPRAILGNSAGRAEPDAEDGCMANDDQWTPPE